MLQTKPPMKVNGSTRWNPSVLEVKEALVEMKRHNKEISVEMASNGLAIVRCGQLCGVTDGKDMVLGIAFDSVDVIDNSWMVAGKNGIYELYNKEGKRYKGLSFLKRVNAIKFARTL